MFVDRQYQKTYVKLHTVRVNIDLSALHVKRLKRTTIVMIIIVITIIITVVVVSTTHHTLVRHGTKLAGFLYLFLCPVTAISATVAPIGVKFCMMVHIGPEQVFSPFEGGAPSNPQIRNCGPKFWPFDGEYLDNGKSQRYMSIRAQHQLDESVLKM